MHFISGQHFTVIPRQQAGPRSLTSRPPVVSKSVPTEFMVGQTYTLYHVRFNRKKKENQKMFTYSFLSSARQLINIDFDSSREADQFIANLANVELPNTVTTA